MSTDDPEKNRMSERARRYMRVGAGVGQATARIAGARLIGQSNPGSEAALLRAALGRLRGPIVKVAQLLATIPDLLPPEYAAELQKLQSQAPAMGWAFVKRRMQAELGPDWRTKFAEFTHEPAAAASLGQVHRAIAHDGTALAVKLQYPDMQSAVEADLKQLDLVFSLHARLDRAIDTSQMRGEIAARIREELDYRREARHLLLDKAGNPGPHLNRGNRIEAAGVFIPFDHGFSQRVGDDDLRRGWALRQGSKTDRGRCYRAGKINHGSHCQLQNRYSIRV